MPLTGKDRITIAQGIIANRDKAIALAIQLLDNARHNPALEDTSYDLRKAREYVREAIANNDALERMYK